MRFIKVFSICLLFLLVFVAAWQNIQPIKDQSIIFRFSLAWLSDQWTWVTKPIPIGLIIPFSFIAGLIVMGVVDIRTIVKLRWQVKRLEKQRTSSGYAEKISAADPSHEALRASSNSWDHSKEKQDTAA